MHRALVLLFLAVLLAGCGGRSQAVPPPPNVSSSGLPPVTAIASPASTAGLAHIPGEILETGESTLDLFSGGHHSVVAHSNNPSSYFEYPAFSPDGKRIAYVVATTPTTSQTSNWGNDVYVANADGSNAKLALQHDHSGVYLDALSWTPDGNSLILAYERSIINAQGYYTGQITRIERLTLATGATTTLIDNASQPSLSWDGKQIVYVTLQANTQEQLLALANSDGSSPRVLFSGQQGFQAFFAPHLSPDGRKIVFAGIGGPLSAQPNAPTPAVPQTVPTPAGRLSPGSPAGRLGDAVAALGSWLQPPQAQADGVPWLIWVANVDGSDLHTLTELYEDLPFPLWSKDGKTVLFLGSTGFYSVNADGSNLTRIANGVAHGQFSWYQP